MKLRVEFRTIDDDLSPDTRVRLDDVNPGDDASTSGTSPIKPPQPPPNMPIPLSLQDFLLGKNCLRGVCSIKAY